MIDRSAKRTKWKTAKFNICNYLIFIFIFLTLSTTAQQRTAPSSDDLYILLDEISVFSCRGGIFFIL